MPPRPNIVITHADRERLTTLISRVESAGSAGLVERRYIESLKTELDRAAVVDPHDVPADVITMNSTARLRDLDTQETFDYTLAYPKDADPDQQRVSVLAPVGTALIGYRQGDVIEWPVPAGKLRLQVEEVLYQPERAGQYDR